MIQTRRDLIEPTVPAAARPAVRISNLVKRIDDRPVLRGLNLEIAEGEFVGLLGANGAGKTTLLKILATLAPPSSGTLELFGRPVDRDPAVRGRIGLISHQSMLYRDLTTRENLELFARLYGVSDVAARVGRMMGLTGISRRASDPVKTLSRGTVQRVAIARALLHDPDLILADEPFAGLDVGSSRVVEEMLSELNVAGKTVVLVTHDIEQSLRMASRSVVLRGGRVTLDEPAFRLYPQEVLSEVMAS